MLNCVSWKLLITFAELESFLLIMPEINLAFLKWESLIPLFVGKFLALLALENIDEKVDI